MEKDKIRTSRASQTRSKEESKKIWTPPNSLDAPPAPEGFRHQWIRAEILGQSDAKNVASSLREGWELVRGDEYPDSQYPTMHEGRYAGVIGVGGLCWQGYQRRLRFRLTSIIKNKLVTKKKQ